MGESIPNIRLCSEDGDDMTRIELLAPAKNLECGIAAVDCGADAVYIGPERFGAREQAGNSLQDIEKLVRHAHKFWARVYATVNTILRDDEISPALELIRRLYETGVDGLIVQDPGLLECDLPPIPLIASTQMNNDTPERVRFLENTGFKRVILARELGLSEIRKIRSATSIELETFIHGALCVSASGRCTMSYAIGGRSGNRGQCGQPCRLPYSLTDENGQSLGTRHWLSLRDLNLSAHIEDLLDAGITSFKIEGRLKDKAYVMNVTRLYRETIDRILEGTVLRKASSGIVVDSFVPDPEKTFNRGYTVYFLNGRQPGMGSPDTPKFTGEPLGEAVSVSRDRFIISTSMHLSPGDGISFFDRDGTLQGSVVNRVEGTTVFPDRLQGIEKGTFVYRNHDHVFIRNLEKSRIRRKIRVEMRLESILEGLRLSARDEDGIEAVHSLVNEQKPAEKKELAERTLNKQLTSMGDSDFICGRLDLNLDEIPFIPVSVLNGLRREILRQLAENRMQNRPYEKRRITPNDVPFPENEITYMGNVLNGKAADFYRRHGVRHVEPAAESGLDMKGKKVMTTRYCLRYEMGKCSGKARSIKPHPPWMLTDRDGRSFRVRFDCQNCRMEIIVE
jgi:23S rRNA 5-hydroxycytidine C2501 synthase